MEALFVCSLCGTRQAETYGPAHDIGQICHRCALLSMVGPDGMLLPHCPPAPDDVDPAILAIQQNRDPLTAEEFDAYVQTMGNRCTGIEKVREIFTDRKIQNWFEEHGDNDGAVALQIIEDPITLEVFQACARKHPPSNFECPGISMETAQLVITTFKALIFLLPHNPDMGEVIGGVLVGGQQDSGCGNCGVVSASNKRCSRCKAIVYCSRGCQRAHWRAHKQNCTEAG
ncbi:hypothetical protein ACHAWF_001707 [Thalassiosira exigua]